MQCVNAFDSEKIIRLRFGYKNKNTQQSFLLTVAVKRCVICYERNIFLRTHTIQST